MKWNRIYNESSEGSEGYSPYIDIPAFRREIEDILNSAVDELEYDENNPEELYVQYMKDVASDYMDEYVDGIMEDTIRSFDKYVHMDNTSMSGNFADIRLDYELDHKGGKKFKEVIAEIDAGEHTPITEEFRNWTIDWYFKAFGTYNLKYKWLNFLEEVAADFEYQQERDAERD